MSRVQQLSADKRQMWWALIDELARVAMCSSWEAAYYRAQITGDIHSL